MKNVLSRFYKKNGTKISETTKIVSKPIVSTPQPAPSTSASAEALDKHNPVKLLKKVEELQTKQSELKQKIADTDKEYKKLVEQSRQKKLTNQTKPVQGAFQKDSAGKVYDDGTQIVVKQPEYQKPTSYKFQSSSQPIAVIENKLYRLTKLKYSLFWKDGKSWIWPTIYPKPVLIMQKGSRWKGGPRNYAYLTKDELSDLINSRVEWNAINMTYDTVGIEEARIDFKDFTETFDTANQQIIW